MTTWHPHRGLPRTARSKTTTGRFRPTSYTGHDPRSTWRFADAVVNADLLFPVTLS